MVKKFNTIIKQKNKFEMFL